MALQSLAPHSPQMKTPVELRSLLHSPSVPPAFLSPHLQGARTPRRSATTHRLFGLLSRDLQLHSLSRVPSPFGVNVQQRTGSGSLAIGHFWIHAEIPGVL